MGWGDEVMALGRAEAEFERTGRPVSIRGRTGDKRDNILWHGNPAWRYDAHDFITDGPGARPYITRWENGNRAIFNLDHKARAGKIHLTPAEYFATVIPGPYAVISPLIKDNASPNKQWGVKRWEKAIEGFPLPVYQLGVDPTHRIIGAKFFHTDTMRHAAAVIEGAAIVLANEGGTHHLAGAMRVPAVVYFGSFIPPSVSGYDYHENIGVGPYCGKWERCEHCANTMVSITPDVVKQKALHMIGVRHV